MIPNKEKAQNRREPSMTQESQASLATSADLSDPTGSGSLEKVREILFGAQARQLADEVGRLENLLVQNLATLREEVQSRFSALESALQSEVVELSSNLQKEHRSREEIINNLSHDLGELAKDLEAKLASLNHQSSKGHQDIRQEMITQQETLSNEIHQKNAELSMEIQQALEELKAEKADRMALASLFEKMAHGLSGEVHSSSEERRTA